MAFFVAPFVIWIIGWLIHAMVDHKPNKKTKARVLELGLLWLLVPVGALGLIGALSHVTSLSGKVAESIGYAPSMFQWEVGWGDFALCALLIGCAWRRLRGTWMTAAVVVLTIQYGGDAIGHIMQYYAHNNTAPNNVWAAPADIVEPLIAIVLLVMLRQSQKKLALVPASAQRQSAPAT